MQHKAPFIGICRHRLARDGEGVTTLAAFHGCPLKCKYCLNPQCQRSSGIVDELSPQELFEKVKIDDLYFQATGGGITFGGGEPAMQSMFIEEFKSICNPIWKINIETCLNVPLEHIERIAPLIHQFIIDIKDMNCDIYSAYSGMDNRQVLVNLEYIAQSGLQRKCIIRLPLIKDYNTKDDIKNSEIFLRRLGFANFDILEYNTTCENK